MSIVDLDGPFTSDAPDRRHPVLGRAGGLGQPGAGTAQRRDQPKISEIGAVLRAAWIVGIGQRAG